MILALAISFLITLHCILGYPVGGKRDIDPYDIIALKALVFGVSTMYPSTNVVSVPRNATIQVVNGLSISLWADLWFSKNECRVESFDVWFRAGPKGEYLTDHSILTKMQCKPHDWKDVSQQSLRGI